MNHDEGRPPDEGEGYKSHREDPEASYEAEESLNEEDLGTLRQTICETIAEFGIWAIDAEGWIVRTLTSLEISDITSIGIQTISPRIKPMRMQYHLLYITGVERKDEGTKKRRGTGRKSNAWGLVSDREAAEARIEALRSPVYPYTQLELIFENL